jgi:FkbM family methyltransferase
MKRFLKTHLNRFLPAAVRSSIKQRMAARFVAPITSQIAVEKASTALRCQIDDDITFLAPENCKHDLAYFTDTVEGQVEFDGIALAARTGGILFDIGAHSGLVSALFCAANPQNVVFSFEPSPLLASRLVEIRDLNQFGERMGIELCGIGEKSAIVQMAFDPVGGHVQTQNFDHSMWSAPQTINVKIENIADAATRLNVIPQFLKIDIEGYESEAIKGSLEFIRRHRPTIFLEVHLNYLEARQLSAKSLVEMLLDAGYHFYTSGGVVLKPSDVYDSPLSIVRVIARR